MFGTLITINFLDPSRKESLMTIINEVQSANFMTSIVIELVGLGGFFIIVLLLIGIPFLVADLVFRNRVYIHQIMLTIIDEGIEEYKKYHHKND